MGCKTIFDINKAQDTFQRGCEAKSLLTTSEEEGRKWWNEWIRSKGNKLSFLSKCIICCYITSKYVYILVSFIIVFLTAHRHIFDLISRYQKEAKFDFSVSWPVTVQWHSWVLKIKPIWSIYYCKWMYALPSPCFSVSKILGACNRALSRKTDWKSSTRRWIGWLLSTKLYCLCPRQTQAKYKNERGFSLTHLHETEKWWQKWAFLKQWCKCL